MKWLVVLFFVAAAFAEEEAPSLNEILGVPLRQGRAGEFAQVSQCGGDGSIVVHKLQLPAIVKMPSESVTLDYDLEVVNQIDNLALHMKIEKKMGFWITIPCINGTLGSCKFDDVCSLVAGGVPPMVVGLLEQYGLSICPFKPIRKARVFSFPIPFEAPTFLAKGKYRLELKFLHVPVELKQTYLCYKIELEIA